MPDGVFIGAILTAVLLTLGVFMGFWFARRQRALQQSEVEPVLSNLLRFTNNFSRDFSEYRALIAIASQHAKQLSIAPLTLSGETETSNVLLTQIVEANELLQKRLVEAEASLQEQSVQLNTYRTEARTDVLTGLTNRRAFDEELNRRVAMFRRQGILLGVMLIDVDRFKSVNDRYGHSVGDAVLVAISKALQRAVRESDLLARYGGEEFAVVLTGNSQEEFCKASERLRREVQTTVVHAEGNTLQPTVSCGVTTILPGDDIEHMFHRADEALYAAKEDGRNCSFWHNGTSSQRVSLSPSTSLQPAESSLSNSEQFRSICSELRRKLEEITK